MAKFIILALRAESKEGLKKEYILRQGINVIQSEKTRRGKTTLLGIIDYCFNGKNTFPWLDITKKYDSVSLDIETSKGIFRILRTLDGTAPKILSGKNFEQICEEDIHDFYRESVGVEKSSIYYGQKNVNLGIRDYAKLFFIRQLDTNNITGNFNVFNKVVQAGKISFGLHELSYLEDRIKSLEDDNKKIQSYLLKLKEDIVVKNPEVNEEVINDHMKRIEEIGLKINNFEDEISQNKELQTPLLRELTQIEEEIRILKSRKREIDERLSDISLLRKDIQSDYSLVKMSEVSLDVLNNFPDVKCPECNSDVENDEAIFCSLCGKKLEERKKEISHFYLINKNTEKELDKDETILSEENALVSKELSSKKESYENLLNELRKIEKSSIRRFSTMIKELANKKESIIISLEDSKRDLQNKNTFKKYEQNIENNENDIKGCEDKLKKLDFKKEAFDKHKELVGKYLKIVSTETKEIEWISNNIFPRIDGKNFLDQHGGSNYVRILISVLASLFELSLNNKINHPSILINDSFRKHEIELSDLENIGETWIKLVEEKGQIIVSGVDIPLNLINKAKENKTYYLLSGDKYSL
jgi:hypothetical protein